RKAVAAIHAGWRGALAGIVPQTIELMRSRFNMTKDDLRISIGPSAGACCYEVDETVLLPLRNVVPEWQSLLQEDRGAKAKLDLKALVRRQIRDCGLRQDQVSSVNLCTICHEELFYSYRREGRVNGTMLSGISLTARQ
ncbi:polyphenol oxidase family protein, partial [Petrachloros mirabilis]